MFQRNDIKTATTAACPTSDEACRSPDSHLRLPIIVASADNLSREPIRQRETTDVVLGLGDFLLLLAKLLYSFPALLPAAVMEFKRSIVSTAGSTWCP